MMGIDYNSESQSLEWIVQNNPERCTWVVSFNMFGEIIISYRRTKQSYDKLMVSIKESGFLVLKE